MQLTSYTDFSLRVLLYLGTRDEGATISEIAAKYRISKNHLVKVVHSLSRHGFINARRGRRGGICLKRDAVYINIGEVVRAMETNCVLVECFCPEKSACVIAPICRLKAILHEAQMAFFDALEQYTLEDLLHDKDALATRFSLIA